MPRIPIEELPPDSDDIGQSAAVGTMLATYEEESAPPFKRGDAIRPKPRLIALSVEGRRIESASLGVRRIRYIRYERSIDKTVRDALQNVGWVVMIDGIDTWIKAGNFELAE